MTEEEVVGGGGAWMRSPLYRPHDEGTTILVETTARGAGNPGRYNGTPEEGKEGATEPRMVSSLPPLSRHGDPYGRKAADLPRGALLGGASFPVRIRPSALPRVTVSAAIRDCGIPGRGRVYPTIGARAVMAQ